MRQLRIGRNLKVYGRFSRLLSDSCVSESRLRFSVLPLLLSFFVSEGLFFRDVHFSSLGLLFPHSSLGTRRTLSSLCVLHAE